MTRFLGLEMMLKKDEGLKLKPYRDSVGKLTIGVGRNLDDVGITENEASMLLYNDILRCDLEARLNFTWFVDLDEVRQDVILSMIFNIGMPKFLGFIKLRKAMETKNYSQASLEMINSKWADQVGKRADRLANMMLTGVH